MTKVDLTNCEREEIHLLGHVQTFGCLIALSSDWLVMHASRNIKDHLGIETEEIIGTPLRDFLRENAVHSIRGAVQTLTTPDAIARLFDIPLLPEREELFNIALHRTGRTTIVEIEPATKSEERGDSLSQVRNIIDRLNTCADMDRLCNTAARFLRAFAGFDRVMVYRFAADDTGEVVAEAASSNLEPFLGLRYPASDIPKQARALYKRSLIRIISDVDDQVSPIIPEVNTENEKLDLSLSTLRAVSPIHLEYLRNMGVTASMSISIIHNGKLWGLFACHHHEPVVLDYRVRSACELFGQMFGFVLSRFEDERRSIDAEAARSLHDDLMRHFAEGADISSDFEHIVDGLSDLVEFDGAACWIDGVYKNVGKTPTSDEAMALVRFLNTSATSTVYATDCLHKVHPPAEDYIDRAAGVLALPVSRTPRDYLMLFRGEVAKTVKWAGNPEKPAEVGPNGIRLTPRKSFEAWQQIVHGQSKEWTPKEMQVAEAIRVTLLEVVLRMSDAAHVERSRAQERQELLIAELNHRVRNILNLIRGLVDQSRSETASVDEFTANVSERIQALARAHDQITKGNWSAASLQELIHTEMKAYLGPKSTRVHYHGTDAIVSPDAVSTLALVIHELTSNSAKYGALTDRHGRIDVTLTPEDDGALQIEWVESDGPMVKAPMRRGFGSTIIERSVPFELGGKAEVSFPMTGVRARFLVPSSHIEKFVAGREQDEDNEAAPVVPESVASAVEGTALLVEDNMIIAMDGERFLSELGAKAVLTASTVAEALHLLEKSEASFALLDLNLGVETSLPVAKKLREHGIPFAFATGYGDTAQLLEDFKEIPVLTKPYDKSSLKEVLLKITS